MLACIVETYYDFMSNVKMGQLKFRACSQIPVLSLTGRAHGGRVAALGAGFCGQNLRISIFHALIHIFE